MGKRPTSLHSKHKSRHSHKTKKRLEIKRVMLAKKKADNRPKIKKMK